MTDPNNHQHGHSAMGTEAWYKDLVDNACDLIQCVDNEGKFIYINQAWRAILNYTAEEIDNITLWDVIHPASMEHYKAVFDQIIEGKAFDGAEAVFVTKDGTLVAVEGKISAKLDENGRFIHTLGIFRDVTTQKRVENVNRLLFDISNAMVTVQCLDELYQLIHATLGRVMDVTNFLLPLWICKNAPCISRIMWI